MYLARSMRTKAVISVIVCTALAISAVAASFELVVFNPAQQKVSIDQILLNPDAWVNRRVIVEGILAGPALSVPGETLPWNYELVSTGTIGVAWNGGTDFLLFEVRVTGIVREETRGGLQQASTVYYIEAEKLAPFMQTMCRFCQNSGP